MKRINLLLLCCMIACLSCQKNNNPEPIDDRDMTIVIMHDNDVHCGADGYAKFAGLRDAIVAADTAYVATVSSGDYIQGEFIGGYSRGGYLIPILKSVGFDALTLGNHEFDYGIPRQQELLDTLGKDRVTCSNFINTDTRQIEYAPYIIKTCGKKKVAFVGVTTPGTVRAEYYAFTDMPYDIPESETVSLVQNAVNDARSSGADYVILLSHMGEVKDPDTDLYAIPLINQTTGIDVVLDGHTHSVIEEQYVKNLNGKDVLLTQTGTKFSHFGKVTISTSGTFHSECIPDSEMEGYSSPAVRHTVDSINAICDEIKSQIVGHTTFELTINDEAGKRLIRKGETNLGDLVCDALMHAGGRRVSFMNGGSIRTSIEAGDITFGDVIAVLPFNNNLIDFEITGKQIAEVLESGFAIYPKENGAFLHVGGLRFTYNSSTTPHICDIQVLEEGGTYTPISESATYTATTTDYVFNDTTSYPSLKGCKCLRNNYVTDYNSLIQYIQHLGGEIPERYSASQNRINIK